MRKLLACALSLAVGIPVACSGKSSDTKTGTPAPTTTSTSTAPAGEGGTPKRPPSEPVGWRAAVGAGGVFVQTFDDRTWETRSAGEQDLYGVACVGNQLGWAVGAGGAIRHTIDGGRTWTPQESGVTSALRSVRFGATTFGVAVGDAGVIRVSHDGGATWIATPSGSGSSTTLRGVAIAQDRGVALVVGDGGTVLRSADAGKSFQSVRVAEAADLQAVAVEAGGHVAIAVDASGGVFLSTDVGVTFTRETTALAALRSVALDEHGELAIAVGDGGLVMERRSGAWSQLRAGTTANLRAALVPDDAYGAAIHYVAGEHGTLLGRRRGTTTWEVVPTRTDATLFGLEDL